MVVDADHCDGSGSANWGRTAVIGTGNEVAMGTLTKSIEVMFRRSQLPAVLVWV